MKFMAQNLTYHGSAVGCIIKANSRTPGTVHLGMHTTVLDVTQGHGGNTEKQRGS